MEEKTSPDTRHRVAAPPGPNTPSPGATSPPPHACPTPADGEGGASISSSQKIEALVKGAWRRAELVAVNEVGVAAVMLEEVIERRLLWFVHRHFVRGRA